MWTDTYCYIGNNISHHPSLLRFPNLPPLPSGLTSRHAPSRSGPSLIHTPTTADQCGSATGSPPVAAALFDPAKDAEFAQSIGGMIWPRGYVAAAAFWHFNSSIE